MLVALTAVAEARHTTETEQAHLPKSAETTDAHTLIKAPANRTDTLSTYEIPEVVVNTSPKQDASQAISTTSVGMGRIRSERIEAVRDLSLITPNLYIPDYGSKMTSSIYIRGIGARIDQPAIGLYVDNIPYLNKNNYDFGFYDIRQVEVLRGPQSSLYGRNTIGGVINLYTLSPLDYQGVRIGVEYRTTPSDTPLPPTTTAATDSSKTLTTTGTATGATSSVSATGSSGCSATHGASTTRYPSTT